MDKCGGDLLPKESFNLHMWTHNVSAIKTDDKTLSKDVGTLNNRALKATVYQPKIKISYKEEVDLNLLSTNLQNG